ncbi:hypothetical protein KW815_22280, partial [Enterobacter quasiroggenkampii]
MPEWAAEAADAQLVISERFGEIDAQQLPILGVEKALAQADSGVPPGVDSFPQPGEAAVSPALADRGMTAQALGFVPSTATSGRPGIIGADGLGGPGELFAHIGVAVSYTQPTPPTSPFVLILSLHVPPPILIGSAFTF